MVGVVVRDEDLRDPRRVVPIGANDVEDLVGPRPEPGIYEGELASPVDQVGVAVEAVGEVEPLVAATDQVDIVGELHRYVEGTE